MPQTIRRSARTQAASPMPGALTAGSLTADVVRVPARSVLAIDGKGAPESPGFQSAVQALYRVAYTLKFALKREDRDFKVGALEGRWWAAEPAPGKAAESAPALSTLRKVRRV